MIDIPCGLVSAVVTLEEQAACERMASDRNMDVSAWLRGLIRQQIRYDELVAEWSERGGFKTMAPALPTDED